MTPYEHPAAEDMDDQAAAWYSRARSGSMSPREEEALAAWLDADPAHRSAYDAIERAWSALDLIRAHPRMLAMRDELPPAKPRLFRRGPPRWAIAACLAVLVLGAGGAAGWRLWRPAGLFDSQTFRTGPEQRAVFTLADGSEVTLNSDTVLRTRADRNRRLVYLDRGRAFFEVAKDKEHPFIVHAAGRTITAVGTAFDVRVEPRQFSVTLVEGKVRVEAPALASPVLSAPGAAPSVEATEMVAGSQLVAVDARRWSVARTDVQDATRWVRDQLVFESKPLAEVVATMNSRSVRKIVIADPSVGEILVSGNFRPGDVDGFARAVEAYEYARISSDAAGSIELSAR